LQAAGFGIHKNVAGGSRHGDSLVWEKFWA